MVFCRQLAAGQEVAAAAVLAVVPCLRIYQLDIILTVENLLANLPAAGAVYAATRPDEVSALHGQLPCTDEWPRQITLSKARSWLYQH